MQSHTYIGETLPSLLIPDLSIRRLIEYILLPPRPLPGSDDLASFVDSTKFDHGTTIRDQYAEYYRLDLTPCERPLE